MKRLTALVIALFLALSLAACSDSGNTPNSSTSTPAIMPPLPLPADCGDAEKCLLKQKGRCKHE